MEARSWWTLKEVREIVFGNNIAPSTLSRFTRENIIPSKRVGSRVYIPDWWVKEMQKNGRGEKHVS